MQRASRFMPALSGKTNGGIVVLFAPVERSDEIFGFHQQSNFYYLTGWTEPGAALIIAPAVEAKQEGWGSEQEASAWRRFVPEPFRAQRSAPKRTAPLLRIPPKLQPRSSGGMVELQQLLFLFAWTWPRGVPKCCRDAGVSDQHAGRRRFGSAGLALFREAY